jgi:hypothetical protein
MRPRISLSSGSMSFAVATRGSSRATLRIGVWASFTGMSGSVKRHCTTRVARSESAWDGGYECPTYRSGRADQRRGSPSEAPKRSTAWRMRSLTNPSSAPAGCAPPAGRARRAPRRRLHDRHDRGPEPPDPQDHHDPRQLPQRRLRPQAALPRHHRRPGQVAPRLQLELSALAAFPSRFGQRLLDSAI